MDHHRSHRNGCLRRCNRPRPALPGGDRRRLSRPIWPSSDNPFAFIPLQDVHLAVFILFDVHPFIRDELFAKKFFRAAAIRTPIRAIDSDSGVAHLMFSSLCYFEIYLLLTTRWTIFISPPWRVNDCVRIIGDSHLLFRDAYLLTSLKSDCHLIYDNGCHRNASVIARMAIKTAKAVKKTLISVVWRVAIT